MSKKGGFISLYNAREIAAEISEHGAEYYYNNLAENEDVGEIAGAKFLCEVLRHITKWDPLAGYDLASTLIKKAPALKDASLNTAVASKSISALILLRQKFPKQAVALAEEIHTFSPKDKLRTARALAENFPNVLPYMSPPRFKDFMYDIYTIAANDDSFSTTLLKNMMSSFTKFIEQAPDKIEALMDLAFFLSERAPGHEALKIPERTASNVVSATRILIAPNMDKGDYTFSTANGEVVCAITKSVLNAARNKPKLQMEITDRAFKIINFFQSIDPHLAHKFVTTAYKIVIADPKLAPLFPKEPREFSPNLRYSSESISETLTGAVERLNANNQSSANEEPTRPEKRQPPERPRSSRKTSEPL